MKFCFKSSFYECVALVKKGLLVFKCICANDTIMKAGNEKKTLSVYLLMMAGSRKNFKILSPNWIVCA